MCEDYPIEDDSGYVDLYVVSSYFTNKNQMRGKKLLIGESKMAEDIASEYVIIYVDKIYMYTLQILSNKD